jgi:hypothetical protein
VTRDNNNNCSPDQQQQKDDQNDITDDDSCDEDYTVKVPRVKTKADLVTLTVSRKSLAKDTAITAKRHRIGVVAQRDILANVINVGGGSTDEFSLSNKTVRKAGAKKAKESAASIKEDFKKMLVDKLDGKKVINVHFDGKSLAQFHDQVKSVEKRLSVIACSPYLSSEQVLGVPITPSSGKDQHGVVVKVLKEWQVMPHILGLGFDTTSDSRAKIKELLS